jgi:dTDP-4-amino-4,6-dideoxygalactose transaminase
MIPVMRPWLGAEEAAAAADAVSSKWVAQGPRVAKFEVAFASAIGAEHAVALSSCTAALHLALVVAGIGPGDEVVVPSLSFIATANAARYVGAVPVFADVDEATQNLTATTVEPCLTSRTRAVIVVDQAGVPADLDAMRALCWSRMPLARSAPFTAADPSARTPVWLPSPFTRKWCSPRVKAACW